MKRWIIGHPRLTAALFLLALVLSNAAQLVIPREWYMLPAEERRSVPVPVMRSGGPGDGQITLSHLLWGPPVDDRPPVVLLHGSPGQSTDFTRLGPELDERRVYALDMPGFGMSSGWVPSYSARAYARYVLAFMDAVGAQRAHVVGWSNSGAVALRMSELAPRRLASITLLGAIGAQETEGSGDYHFEHAKYAVGYAAVVVLPEFIPHFGLLFPREYRHAFIRNFWDTDQRDLAGVMRKVHAPVLILHGRHDFLVAPWAAERHHELIPTSRLIMTGHGHFMPFLQPGETAAHIETFLSRHDEPGVPPETGTLDLAPRPERSGFAGVFDASLVLVREAPWWAMALVFAALARLRRETATALAGVFVGHAVLDFGVAFVGLLAGRALHPREPWLEKDWKWVAGLPVWTALALLTAQIACGFGSPVDDMGPLGFILWIALVAITLNAVKLAPTRTGRRRIVANARRLLHHEWWPAPVLYGLLAPHFVRLALRHRSVLCWTCVNPGVRPGGGVIGESKHDILRGFDDPRVLPQRRLGVPRRSRVPRLSEPVSSSSRSRVDQTRRLLDTDPDLAGFPVIVKPDAGQRGADVALARDHDDIARAVAAIRGPVCLQRFHPGPVEIGAFWVRDPDTVGNERDDRPQGRVFAVTRKIFPEIAGDGRRPLRRLILDDPRSNLQAHVHCRQLADRLDEVPRAGERVRLTGAGNHARGCRFEDGADLVTPEFSEAVDSLARAWRGPTGERFDFGRFDIRAASEDGLRAGRGLAVIELNGVTSEATNLYDPSWTPRQGLGLLARQWSIAFELGAVRKARGAEPLTIPALVAALFRSAR